MSAFLFFLLGLAFGSFGNVIIHRLPRGESIGGRSRYPGCSRTLSPLELIPVVSFVALRGRCRSCRRPISLQYPLIEVVSGILFVLALRGAVSILPAAVLAGAFWLLLLVAVIDARTQGIPDALSIPLLLLTGVFAIVQGHGMDWWSVVVPVGFFGAQWLLSGGRWIGSGDVVLGAALGMLLQDWHRAILMILIAYITGACVAIALMALGRVTRKSALAFGPFLAIAGLIAFFLPHEWIVLFFAWDT